MKWNSLMNIKTFFIIFLIFLLFGCGSPCRTKANEKAAKLIKSELKNTENNQMYSCGFITDLEEYVLDIYGYSDDELGLIMKNIKEASKIPNVNMKILFYKSPLHFARSQDSPYFSVVKPDEKPFLTIKIKNKGE